MKEKDTRGYPYRVPARNQMLMSEKTRQTTTPGTCTRESVHLHRGQTEKATKKMLSSLLLRVETHQLTPEIKLLR